MSFDLNKVPDDSDLQKYTGKYYWKNKSNKVLLSTYGSGTVGVHFTKSLVWGLVFDVSNAFEKGPF